MCNLWKAPLWGVLVLVLSLMLAACQTSPPLDTANKRAYATELAVQGMLEQIDQYEQEGRFTDSEWQDVREQLERLQVAYRALEEDIELGRDPGANIETINAVLITIRPYLE